jgi:hypothetical protein
LLRRLGYLLDDAYYLDAERTSAAGYSNTRRSPTQRACRILRRRLSMRLPTIRWLIVIIELLEGYAAYTQRVDATSGDYDERCTPMSRLAAPRCAGSST